MTITISGANLRALSEGTHTITADVSDLAGNAATQASTTFIYDKSSPSCSISSVSWGSYLNATEDNNNGTVTVATNGAENGSTVTVGLNGVNYNGSVSSNSVTITIPGANLRALSEGTHTITADVSDLAGNAATQASTTFIYDKSSPSCSISSTSWGSYLNATEDNNNGTVTVTTNGVENGITVIIGLNGVNYTGLVSSNSVTITIPGANLRALSEGTHIITANVSDLAGNAATQASTTFIYDTIPTLNEITPITTPTNDNTPSYVFSSNEAGTITSSLSITGSTSVVNGNNTITFSLQEGTYSGQTITVTDAAGNSTTLTISPFVIDTTYSNNFNIRY